MVDESQVPTGGGDDEQDAAGPEAGGDIERGALVSDSESTGSSDSATEVTSLKSSFTPGQPASTTSKILVVLFATVLVIGGIYVASPDDISDTLSQEREGFEQEVQRNYDLGYKSPFLSPGINQPEIRPASDVRFAAKSPVIGITVGKASRVYPMVTLMPSFTIDGENCAVVNDKLGGMLVTVTNDVDAELVRVFRLSEASTRKTIGLWLMGMEDGGGMGLTFDNIQENDFRQDQTEIPDLADHPFEASTFAEWVAKHPESDVYVGEFVTPDLQMEYTLTFMSAPERVEADRVLKERNEKRKVLSPKRKRGRKAAGKAKQSKTSSGSAAEAGPSGSQPEPGSGGSAASGDASSPGNR